MSFSYPEKSSHQDSLLVAVVGFLGGVDLFVVVGEHCCFSEKNLDVLPNLSCKCLNMNSSVAW